MHARWDTKHDTSVGAAIRQRNSDGAIKMTNTIGIQGKRVWSTATKRSLTM